MEFSTQDAQIVLGFVTSLVVPFVVSFLKNPKWASWQKLALALGCSLVAGFLTVYTTEGLDVSRIAVALVAIAMAAHTHYQTWFKGLGLEDKLKYAGPFVDEYPATGPLTPADFPDPEEYKGTPRGY